MDTYKLTAKDMSRGVFNHRSFEAVCDYVESMELHYYDGMECDTVEKWERRLLPEDIIDDERCGYLEDVDYEGGSPYEYDTDDHDYPPVYQDGERYQIVKLELPESEDADEEYYGLLMGGELFYA